MLGNAFIVSPSLRSRRSLVCSPRRFRRFACSQARYFPPRPPPHPPPRGARSALSVAIQERFGPSLLRTIPETSWIPAFNQERPDRLR